MGSLADDRSTQNFNTHVFELLCTCIRHQSCCRTIRIRDGPPSQHNLLRILELYKTGTVDAWKTLNAPPGTMDKFSLQQVLLAAASMSSGPAGAELDVTVEDYSPWLVFFHQTFQGVKVVVRDPLEKHHPSASENTSPVPTVKGTATCHLTRQILPPAGLEPPEEVPDSVMRRLKTCS